MIKPKKHFGQNFLKDSYFLDKIVEAMPDTSNIVVEIGPGLGDLTQKLLIKREVVAIEVDGDLVGQLKKKFAKEISEKKLTLIHADALEQWSSSELLPQHYDLVANLPYYVATNIVLRAFRDNNCKNIEVLVQKEVAEKFCAVSGESSFCALSVLTMLQGDSNLLFDIPPQAFFPPPKVVSSVMIVKKHSKPIEQEFYASFSKWLASAFSAPRKTLLKALSSYYDKNILMETFNKLDLSQTLRAHEMTTSQLIELYKLLNH